MTQLFDRSLSSPATSSSQKWPGFLGFYSEKPGQPFNTNRHLCEAGRKKSLKSLSTSLSDAGS